MTHYYAYPWDYPGISEVVHHRKAIMWVLVAILASALIYSVGVPWEIAIAPLLYLLGRQIWMEIVWCRHHFR